jgi:4-hydroxy-tetrahydrodipicolinate synthase
VVKKMMKHLNGLVPVLITPLNEDGSVDSIRLKALTEHLCRLEISGLWVLGTGSEDMSLTFKQRLKVAESVSEADTNDKVIIMGAGFFSYQDSLDLIAAMDGLEFDALHCMPYHPVISHERIEWIYEDLAEKSSKPVWMYFSENWSQTLPVQKISRLAQHPNIGGVKYSTSNIVNILSVAQLNNTNFQVITAVVRTLYNCLQLGIKATTTVDGCAYHRPIIEIFDLFVKGQNDKALALQIKLNTFLDSLPKGPGKDNFLKVAESKYVLSCQGLSGETMSAPYRGLTDEEKAEIDNLLEQNKGWI